MSEEAFPDGDRPPAPLAPDSANLDRVIALNNAHAAELSRLTADGFREMLARAFRARRFGEADAFLLAFDQNADYRSPNFRWFRARVPRFVYVDRVAVAPHARGRGLARRLYVDLFTAAAQAGHDIVCCEVNRDPPNPASDAFHAALGFREVGSQSIQDGAKTVRYLQRAIGPRGD